MEVILEGCAKFRSDYGTVPDGLGGVYTSGKGFGTFQTNDIWKNQGKPP